MRVSDVGYGIPCSFQLFPELQPPPSRVAFHASCFSLVNVAPGQRVFAALDRGITPPSFDAPVCVASAGCGKGRVIYLSDAAVDNGTCLMVSAFSCVPHPADWSVGCFAPEEAKKVHALLEEGNDAFRQGEHASALEKYDAALLIVDGRWGRVA